MPAFTKDYHVAGYECDQDSTLSTATIFNWLQDSMDKFSRTHDIGYDHLKPQGLTYILRGYDVLINNLPHWSDDVQMETSLQDSSMCSLFFRQNLYAKHDKRLLFSGTSQVALMDFFKKKPARIQEHLPLSALDSLKSPVIMPTLQALARVDTVRTQEIPYDHIDFNQHVNNTNYVLYAQRAIDPLFLKKARLKRIQIAYKKAAQLGDRLKVETQIAPGFTDHQISSQTQPNQQFARVRLAWVPKTDR